MPQLLRGSELIMFDDLGGVRARVEHLSTHVAPRRLHLRAAQADTPFWHSHAVRPSAVKGMALVHCCPCMQCVRWRIPVVCTRCLWG